MAPRAYTRSPPLLPRFARAGAAEVDTPWGPHVVVASPGPERVEFYVLDPTKRTYRISVYGFVTQVFNGESGVALPVGKVCFQRPPLVAAGMSDAERLQAVNAQVSPDLGIVTTSHNSNDIRIVDYEVTNIRREEPPTELFEVLANYTLVHGSADDPDGIFAPWQSPPACKPVKR